MASDAIFLLAVAFSLRAGAEDMSDLTGGSEADLLALMARRAGQAAVDES